MGNVGAGSTLLACSYQLSSFKMHPTEGNGIATDQIVRSRVTVNGEKINVKPLF